MTRSHCTDPLNLSVPVHLLGLAGDVAGFRRAPACDPHRPDRDPQFHHRAHGRFRELLPTIPADATFNSEELDAEQIAAAIADMLDV
jgi:hypothetical protein